MFIFGAYYFFNWFSFLKKYYDLSSSSFYHLLFKICHYCLLLSFIILHYCWFYIFIHVLFMYLFILLLRLFLLLLVIPSCCHYWLLVPQYYLCLGFITLNRTWYLVFIIYSLFIIIIVILYSLLITIFYYVFISNC